MIYKKTIDALVYSNCWIALGASASCLQFYLLTGQEVNYLLLAFLFSSTLLTYTFQRFVKLNRGAYQQSARMLWMKKRPKLVNGILFAAFLSSLFLVFFFSIQAVGFLALMAVISYFYVQRIPGKRSRNLRDRPFIKIYLIAGVWAMTSVFLPVLLLEDFEWNTLLLSVVNFFFILAITIPFDIRDVDLDEADKRTIPQLVGIPIAKMIASLFALISFVLWIYLYPTFWPPAVGSALFTLGLIMASKKDRPDQYYSFFVDGLLLLQCGLIGLYDYLSIYESVPHP